jgi:tetratricopeptide (TPR) repeat protein
MKQKCAVNAAAAVIFQGMSLAVLATAMSVLAASQSTTNQSTAGAATKDQEIAEHRAKAQRYLMHKEPELAVAELQALEVLTPDDVEVHANLGVLLFFKNDCARAVPELRRAIELREGLWRQVELLGFCEQQLGDAANAEKDLEAAFPHLDDAKMSREAGNALLSLYAGNGELQKASSVIAALREKNPTDVNLIYQAYQIYTDLAGEAMISLSLVSPDSAEMHVVMAHESLRYGDRVTGITHLRQALKLNPKMSGIHFELGEALNSPLEGGNKAEAEKEYEQALAENPNDEMSECRLGEMAADRGDLPGSFKHYSHAVELQPKEPIANLGLAKALASMKQPQQAATLLEGVIQRDPTYDIAHFRLSTVYRQLGRPEDAKRELAEYQKYKEMKEKLRTIYRNLRLHKNGLDEGEPDAQK